MPKAKKLPSGSWRCRIYAFTDSNGKQHYESFTAPSKAEAEMAASQYSNSKKRRARSDLTVAEAIEGYILSKEAVLSPKTIKEYRQMQRTRYGALDRIQLRKLTTEIMQRYVSDLSRDVSPKTVTNAYGLLRSAITFYQPDLSFSVTLPKKGKARRVSPEDDQVAALFQAASRNMKIAIALAAFGSLRRGEICAVKYGDISGNLLSVHADMIQDSDRKWIYKAYPKTSESTRIVALPAEVINLIGSGPADEFILKILPSTVTTEFTRFRDELGFSFRFHDLRHYYASVGAVLGVPDNYIADFGGWRKGSPVMKEVYQDKIVSMADIYSDKMNQHFSGVLKKI